MQIYYAICTIFRLSVFSQSSPAHVSVEKWTKKNAFSAKCVKNAVNYVTAISQKSSNFAPQFKFTAMRKILFTLLAVLALTGCNAQNNKTQMTNHKCLVVFFSHAGENYSVGNIQVGNTKIVADYISELTGADRFEIVTHKYDGMAYTPLTELAQEEARNNERPAFEGQLSSLSGSGLSSLSEAVSNYDIIFIGGPIW